MIFEKTLKELSQEELLSIFKLRQEVFMIEQGIKEVDIDDHDINCKHLFIKFNGKIVSYARLINEQGELYIGRIATDIHYRKNGYSSKIIEYLKTKHDVLAISSQEQRISFYKKLGFIPVGKKYKDANILHQKMVYIK